MEQYEKIEKWIESITSDKLEGVAIETKGLKDWDLDPRSNKLIFKALLCLSHTAVRCNPSQTKLGEQLFSVTDNICYSLTEIPDLIKYYSSLYHISRQLIAMQLYPEAMRVTVWSFPSNLVRGLTSEHLDMYPKIAGLWHTPAVNLLDSLPLKSSKTDHKLLLEFFSNELRVLEVVAKKRSAYVLSRVIRFLTKIDGINAGFEPLGNLSHRNVVRKFLDRIEVVLVDEDKYEVYHEALKFINLATAAKVAAESVDNAPAALIDSYEVLKPIFSRDTELSSCFLLYKHMALALLKPVNKPSPYWEVDLITEKILDMIQQFKKGMGISWNVRMLGYILQSLFDRWENCVSSCDEGFLNSRVLSEVLRLIQTMIYASKTIPTKVCEVCRDNGCKMRKNTHTVTVVSIRSLVILSKISNSDLLKGVFPLVKELLEENVLAILEMKEAGCAQWPPLWNNCGINIYNLGVTFHKAFYEETAFLFSLLCSCVVRFEGINTVNSGINIKNALPHVLHRLSSVHFNQGNYREALTPCALNGLLSYQLPDSKAFRMWASIKHACADSRGIMKMTMLSCLRMDMDVISEIGVDVKLTDYDLSELCLQELRGLHEARSNLSLAMQSTLEELQTLNSGGLEYVHGVNLLGYHLLHYQWDENFPKYLKRAARKLREDKSSGDLGLLAAAGVDFYTFVTNLHGVVQQTKAEMETAKLSLRAARSVPSDDGQPEKNHSIVPTYSRINISEDSKLFSHLKEALNKWSSCIESDIIGIVEEWHLAVMLRTMVIAGEYCRLHKFSALEINAWELAYRVASRLKDSKTCVYVVGRILSLRNVNSQWISTGNELTMELESSSESEADNAVAFFWVGLSNLYFELGKHEEAAEILQRVLSLPNITPIRNTPGYLSSMDMLLRNYHLCSNDDQSTNYMVYIARCIYSMLALMDYTPQPRVGVKEKQLYSSEVLITCTSHLSLRMNSMLSYKEISSHLINRLKLSQASGVTLRAAECLKNLCFIDLSRMQLDDCVVKIQALEFILQTEYIGESQSRKDPETAKNWLKKPGARDTRVNDTSPVLKRTVFKLPDFVRHGENCSCYKCSSLDYRHLVMSASHIRAELYFLQGHLDDAVEHFNGAFFLRRKMARVESRREINWREMAEGNNAGIQHLWRDYYNTVEYVLLLLDFSRFIRELEFEDGVDVAACAVEICDKFLLQDHPICVAAKELVLEYQFCGVFKEEDFGKFTVPEPTSIDINKFLQPVSNLESSGVATPAAKPRPKKPKTMRRNKTPPLLKFNKVSMVLSEDEDEEEKKKEAEDGSQSPKSSRQRRNKNYTKSMTRKKLQEFLDDASDSENDLAGASRLKAPREVEMMVKEAVSMFPVLSEKLAGVLEDEGGLNESEKIQKVIRLVEQQIEDLKSEPKTESMDHGRRGGSRSHSKIREKIKNRERDEAVEKLVTSFREILIEKKDLKGLKNSLNSAFSLNDESHDPSTPSFDPSFASEDEKGGPLFANEHRALRKRAKKRLELGDCAENTSSSIDKEQELNERNERLRTSKISLSQSGERKGDPKISSGIKEAGKIKQDAKQRRRIGRSKSEMSCAAPSASFETTESSQLEDSDIILSSDAEEKGAMEARQNGALRQYKTRASSRIVRSRSQINGAASGVKKGGDLESVATSDQERSRGIEARASGRARGSDERLDPCSRDCEGVGPSGKKEGEDVTEKMVLKDPGGAAKTQNSKRATSGRPKGRR